MQIVIYSKNRVSIIEDIDVLIIYSANAHSFCRFGNTFNTMYQRGYEFLYSAIYIEISCNYNVTSVAYCTFAR